MNNHAETTAEFLESVADGKSLTGADRDRLRQIATRLDFAIRWIDNHSGEPLSDLLNILED